MGITLVTGTPGAGKSLYAVSELLPKWQKESIPNLVNEDGSPVPRRLCVGGIRDLLLDHDLIDVPRILDWDGYKDEWSAQVREPGSDPLPVPMRADNWWLWCRPGDVIVIDEAQMMFRPAASGRRVPRFITALEIHRHYGVDFLLITQHPNLLHVNVRALINPHYHVRRVWGGSRCFVYEWDKCHNPHSVSTATKHQWRHSKKAFSLYKSAELHTKPGGTIPAVAFVALAAIVAVPVALWYAFGRTPAPVSASPASSPAAVEPAQLVPLESGPTTAASPPRIAPGPVAFGDSLAPQKHWPMIIVGCWQQAHSCQCITREERPRIVTHLPGLCTAVVAGDLQPPPGLPRPQRIEPNASPVVPVSAPASGPSPGLAALLGG